MFMICPISRFRPFKDECQETALANRLCMRVKLAVYKLISFSMININFGLCLSCFSFGFGIPFGISVPSPLIC